MKHKCQLKLFSFQRDRKVVIILKIDPNKLKNEVLKLLNKKEDDFESISFDSTIEVNENSDFSIESENSIFNLNLTELSKSNNTSHMHKSLIKLSVHSTLSNNACMHARDVPDFKADKSVFAHARASISLENQRVQAAIQNSDEIKNKTLAVNKWKAKHFLDYIRKKHKETYGHGGTLQFLAENNSVGTGYTGRDLTMIKNGLIKLLVGKKIGNKVLGNEDVKDYIDFVYDNISPELDYPVTLAFLKSRNVIDGWLFKDVSENAGRRKSKISKRKRLRGKG